MQRTSNSLLDFERFGCAIAFRSLSGEEWSYQGFAGACDAFGQRLGGEKALILVRTDNSIQSFIAIYGAMRAGHAVILADKDNEGLCARLLEAYQCNYQYYPDKDELISLSSDGRKPLHADLAMLLSTSGSTGSSKGVRISYDALSANASSIAEYLGIALADTALLIAAHPLLLWVVGCEFTPAVRRDSHYGAGEFNGPRPRRYPAQEQRDHLSMRSV